MLERAAPKPRPTPTPSSYDLSTPPLHKACAEGDLNKVKKILDEDTSLNQLSGRNQHGQTALHIAAANGFYEIVEYIITLCDKEDVTATVLRLVDEFGYTPYHSALRKKSKNDSMKQDSEKTAQALLARNNQFEKDWPLHRSRNNQDTPLHNLVHNEFSIKLIQTHLALLVSYTTCPKDNVAFGINAPNLQNITPLSLAVLGDSLELVQTLLKYGADPTLPDLQGYDCLHLAVQANKHSIVRVLLANEKYSALLRTTKNYKSIFHIAAEAADVEMLHILFQKWRTLNSANRFRTEEDLTEEILTLGDNQGNTLAHLAAQAEKKKNYDYLVRLGANVTTLLNKSGKTAQNLLDSHPLPSSAVIRDAKPALASFKHDGGSSTSPTSRSGLTVPPTQHSVSPAVQNNILLGVAAAPLNNASSSANPVAASVNNAEPKSWLKKSWESISKSGLGKWVKNNKVAFSLLAAGLIVALGLTTYIALSVAFPGSSIFTAIPIVAGVHAAIVALHIPITAVPWLVPAVSIALPELAYPFVVGAAYDVYVGFLGVKRLFSLAYNRITKKPYEYHNYKPDDVLNYSPENLPPAATAPANVAGGPEHGIAPSDGPAQPPLPSNSLLVRAEISQRRSSDGANKNGAEKALTEEPPALETGAALPASSSTQPEDQINTRITGKTTMRTTDLKPLPSESADAAPPFTQPLARAWKKRVTAEEINQFRANNKSAFWRVIDFVIPSSLLQQPNNSVLPVDHNHPANPRPGSSAIEAR